MRFWVRSEFWVFKTRNLFVTEFKLWRKFWDFRLVLNFTSSKQGTPSSQNLNSGENFEILGSFWILRFKNKELVRHRIWTLTKILRFWARSEFYVLKTRNWVYWDTLIWIFLIPYLSWTSCFPVTLFYSTLVILNNRGYKLRLIQFTPRPISSLSEKMALFKIRNFCPHELSNHGEITERFCKNNRYIL